MNDQNQSHAIAFAGFQDASVVSREIIDKRSAEARKRWTEHINKVEGIQSYRWKRRFAATVILILFWSSLTSAIYFGVSQLDTEREPLPDPATFRRPIPPPTKPIIESKPKSSEEANVNPDYDGFFSRSLYSPDADDPLNSDDLSIPSDIYDIVPSNDVQN